jgi:putative FmdB family regulatory protein
MPHYDYRCEACGDVFEVKQRISDEPLKIHENCGGKVERLISASALQFKGTGFYITDYARASSKGDSAKGDSKGDSSKGDSAKGDSSKSSKESSEGKSSKVSAKTEAPAKKSD